MDGTDPTPISRRPLADTWEEAGEQREKRSGPVERDLPPVTRAAAHLGRNLDGLRGHLQELERRLRPVLTQAGPQPETVDPRGVAPGVDGQGSDLGHTLHGYCATVDDASALLAGLLQRLEI